MTGGFVRPASTFFGVHVSTVDANLEPPAADHPRVDLVAMIVWPWSTKVMVWTGTPGPAPVAPVALDRDTVGYTWLAVAHVMVRPGATVITKDDVTNLPATGYQR